MALSLPKVFKSLLSVLIFARDGSRMGYMQMLRVSKVDYWLNRQPARRDLRTTGDCVIIRSAGAHRTGVSGLSAGARALGLNLVMIPPGSRGMPHYHDGHEVALYLVSGE